MQKLLANSFHKHKFESFIITDMVISDELIVIYLMVDKSTTDVINTVDAIIKVKI